jgi:hypothetical protein
MRKFFFSSFILFLFSLPAISASITLAWDPSVSPNISSYLFDYGTSPNPSETGSHINVGNVTKYTLDNIPVGIKHYFTVRAVNTSGLISLPSNEITYTISIPTPTPTPTPIPTPTPTPTPTPSPTPIPTPTPLPNNPKVVADRTSALPGNIVKAIVSGGSSNRNDWVGLFPIGASNDGYVNWYYLNGKKTLPDSPLTSAILDFQMLENSIYEFRYFHHNPNGVVKSEAITVGSTPTPTPTPSPSPTATPSPTPVPTTLQLIEAVSRRAHGVLGNFDVAISRDETSVPPIESRNGTNFILVLTFNKNVVSGTATPVVRSGKKAQLSGNPTFSGNTMTIRLKNVSDAQLFRVNLTNIKSNDGSVLASAVVRCRVLIGDVDSNNIVNNTDLNLVDASRNSNVIETNFRLDVNFTGNINSTDVTSVRNHLGNTAPSN